MLSRSMPMPNIQKLRGVLLSLSLSLARFCPRFTRAEARGVEGVPRKREEKRELPGLAKVTADDFFEKEEEKERGEK